MSTEFNKITEGFKDQQYIEVSTDEMTVNMLSFYSLPARKVARLYSKQSKPAVFLKDIYKLIHLAMENPKNFKTEVFDRSVTYSGLIEFLNTWVFLSSLTTPEGKPRLKEKVNEVDAIQNLIYSKLEKNEPIKDKLLIRYLATQIRDIAYNHNQTCSMDDLITEVVITIPVTDSFNDGDWQA